MSAAWPAVFAAAAVVLAGLAWRGRVVAARPIHHRPAVARRRLRRPPPDPEVLADHLSALATEVRAGRSLVAAQAAVPAPPWLHQPRWAEHPHVALVRQMLDATGTLGGAVAPALDAAAAVLRQRAAVAADVAVHAAQARLSARVLTTVPVGFAMWAAATDARVRAVYLGSGVGPWLVAAGGALNALGWWWMRRLAGSIR